MNKEISHYVLDLEGRVAALSGMVALMIWVLRQRGVMDAELERQLFLGASDAAASLPPNLEASADKLILAVHRAAGATRVE